MTREERLDWLCRLRSGLVWFDVPPKERPMFEEALSEEINDLQQEPCEDCISRQAVIDGIKRYFHDEYYQRTSIQDCRDCLIEDVIKDIPTCHAKSCDDAISRQGAIDAIWTHATKTLENSDYEYGALLIQDIYKMAHRHIAELIQSLPTVTSQPKTGEWVSEIVDAEDWKGIKRRCYQPTSCSVCHKPCAIEYPYCPRCGAKMRTEAESEENNAR